MEVSNEGNITHIGAVCLRLFRQRAQHTLGLLTIGLDADERIEKPAPFTFALCKRVGSNTIFCLYYSLCQVCVLFIQLHSSCKA